jgi:hypothetical protein
LRGILLLTGYARMRRDSSLAMAQERTMKAIVQDAYGSADVLELRDIDKPAVGHDGVLLRVHAAGVNPGV